MNEINQPDSIIQIIFKAPGNVAEFTPYIHGVNALQLFAVAEYLRVMGERMFTRELDRVEEEQQRNRIAIPGMDLNELGV